MAPTEKPAAHAGAAHWGVGVAIGLGFGVMLGAALQSVAIGVALGTAFAVVYALMMGDLKKRHDEDAEAQKAEGPRP